MPGSSRRSSAPAPTSSSASRGRPAPTSTELERFLEEARLDAVGVFGYSDEDGTEAAGFSDKVGAATIARRVTRLTDLVEQLTAQRAEERIGTEVEVLLEEIVG